LPPSVVLPLTLVIRAAAARVVSMTHDLAVAAVGHPRREPLNADAGLP
jgi:hypothetical protein